MALDPLEQMQRDRQRAIQFARSRGINLGQQPSSYGLSMAQPPTAPNYAGPPATMPQMQQPTQGLGLQPPRATVRGGGRPMSQQAQAWQATRLNPAAPAEPIPQDLQPQSRPTAPAAPTGFMGRMLSAAGNLATGYGIGHQLNRSFGPAFNELDARAAAAFSAPREQDPPMPELTPPLREAGQQQPSQGGNVYPGGLQKRMAMALPQPESLRDPVTVADMAPAGEPETISGLGFQLPGQRPRLRANRTVQPVEQMAVPDVPALPDFHMPGNINPNDPFAMRQVMLGLQAQMLPYAMQNMQRKAAMGFNKQMVDQAAAMEAAQAAHDRNTIDVDQALRNEDIWRARTMADVENQRIQSDASMSNARLAANAKAQEQAWEREKAGAEMMGIQTYNELGQPAGTRAVPRYQFGSSNPLGSYEERSAEWDAVAKEKGYGSGRDAYEATLRAWMSKNGKGS